VSPKVEKRGGNRGQQKRGKKKTGYRWFLLNFTSDFFVPLA